MPITMFNASVPVFIRGLTVMSDLLDKGAAHAAEHGFDTESLVAAKLAPDMLTLTGQVQRASDTAKFAAARLTLIQAPSFNDDENTIGELKGRCEKTITFLRTFDEAAFDGSESRLVTFGGAIKQILAGEAYLLRFALPNFFFHIATAHDILRNRNVKIGKNDYLGPSEGVS